MLTIEKAPLASHGVYPAMPQNFIACDRDQELLLPPSLKDWLADEHLAWFVLEAVEELDPPTSMPPTAPTAGAGGFRSRQIAPSWPGSGSRGARPAGRERPDASVVSSRRAAADSPPDGSRGGGYNSEYVTRNTVVAIMDVRALAERRDPFEIRIDVTK